MNMITHGRTERSLINTMVSLVNRLVVTLLPFLIRTIMIQTIGIKYLGLDSLFSAILNMLSLSELGFSSAVVYMMYKPVADEDDEKMRALLTFYKKVYRIVGFVILGLGLALLPFLDWFIVKGTTYPSDVNVLIVYLVFLFNTSISYLLFAYKSSILVATMRNDIDSFIDMIRSVLSHGLQIAVLLLFKQYYLYILILPIVTISNNITRKIIIDKRFPQFKGTAVLSKKETYDIMTRVAALIGNKIGGVVFTSVDFLVISKYLGLVVLAQYTNYYTIMAAVYGVASAIYTSFQSVIGNTLVCKSKDENYLLFKDLFLINAIFSCVCTCCFITLYQPFIRIWLGESNVLPLIIPMLLALYFFVKSTRRICFVFKEAAGMWKEDFLKPYVSVTLNFTVNIILVQIIGLPGVIISSILALVLVEIPWETHVFFKNFFYRSPLSYYKNILLSILICVVAVAVSSYLCSLMPEGMLGIAIRLIITIAICVAIYFPIIMFIPYFKNTKQRITRILKHK